ncbi:MAG: 2-oxoacid ferredoxin oxidoreductase [Candidatus Heimdallarchaeota archaeon]|nr:2-oxoacid ferredoxin oxidoreductase [Candidatus Heimdallarchaeota archaeon]
MGDIDIAWCPGCGDFPLLRILKESLADLDIAPKDLVVVSGIGQAAKTPQYFVTNYFNGLHGRSLPVAMGIKAVNPDLHVIAESGDGCMYGEGGNHFIHAMRRNIDITMIVHNNMVYGLTKGQASPTSLKGMQTPVQPSGVIVQPMNPLALAIAQNAPFVARAFVGDRDETKDLLKQALSFKGFALIDIFQPCVTFNDLNTYSWFKKRTYYLDDSHDPNDKTEAFRRATKLEDKLPLGIFYKNPELPTFEEKLNVYQEEKTPVIKRERTIEKIAEKFFSV